MSRALQEDDVNDGVEDNNNSPELTLTSCGINTVLDPTTNQCQCPSATDVVTTNPNDDPNVIYIGGIYDTTNYEWSPEIFQVTVDLINSGWWDALPPPAAGNTTTTTLAYTLLNSNCDETTAVRAYWDLRTANGNVPPHGLVGTRCSGPSLQLARIAGLEGVPQVSPASNSAKLSSATEFPFFSRMVAPNNEQGEVGALVATMRAFGWERITILATDRQFSKDLVTEFRKLWVGPHNDESGVWTGSIAYSDEIRISEDSVDEDSLEQVMANIPVDDPSNNSRVILMLAHSQHAFRILEHAAETGFQPDSVWVGPSAWVGRTDSSIKERTGFDWLPQVPGYLGVAPYRNDDENYRAFLSELQTYQQARGKPVSEDLPPFAAETVDGIVALTKAIASTPNRRDGSAIVNNLRQLDFGGVSGNVQLTPDGDRKDPLFTLFNSQSGASEGDIVWTEVGVAGTGIGSVLLNSPNNTFADICFAEVGCGLDMAPIDTYPESRIKLPIWVSVSISLLAVLLLAMAVKYWRSRRSKKSIKAELQALQKSIVGMRAACCDYVPHVSKAEGDEEQPLFDKASPTTLLTPGQKVVQWCWRESMGCMDQHGNDDIYGDPADCWIKYDSVNGSGLENAFQSSKTSYSFMADAYKVDIGAMRQTKIATGFQRDVCRFEENCSGEKESSKVNLGEAMMGSAMPADLLGEPQMVLVEGDIVQITSQRDDGWAFGTKLHHADEDVARQILFVATGVASEGEVDDANVFTDTGWFQLESTRIPTSEDLEALQGTVGKVDAGSLDPPSSWEPVQDPTVAQRHELPEGHPERVSVVQEFLASISGRQPNIVKVERIQNLSMYQSYVVKRSTICYRETGHNAADSTTQANAIARFERHWLWHGSNVEVVGKILNQGFNRSFCGKNATAYGKGVYFARDSAYSACKTYSVPDFKGNQYMLACRVCVGEYCFGKHDALTPDVRDAKSHSLYDSTVNNMNNPSIYVTYHDAQAYPEYLITFRS